MLRRTILKGIAATAASGLLGRAALAHTPLKIGIGMTPTALAVASLATEAKKATLVLSLGASITTTKSPYFVRAGFILAPQSWILAEWAAKNGSKRVVTLVNDWAPG